MTPCTHTKNWHREMTPCRICGAEYTDEEVERISAAQMEEIGRHEQESEENQ